MRLTKRSNKTVHENGVCCTHFRGKECSERMGECTDNCPWEEAVWSKLADYEDAEEQGLLLRLPCKVGEKIYYSSKTCGVTTFTIVKIGIYEDEILFEDESENIWEEKEFGKTVFLTKAEAESALAEKGGAE